MIKTHKGTITSIYFDDTESVSDPCTIERSESAISVTYFDPYAEREVTYRGDAKGPGHYEVARDDGAGRGTFHCFQDSEIIEGNWTEEGEGGMWIVKLKPDNPV